MLSTNEALQAEEFFDVERRAAKNNSPMVR
jgi:hypothetical protein